jgi:hypothetical protein
MNQTVPRYELKYLLTNISARHVSAFLSRFDPALVKQHPDRYVNNIYFETYGNDCLLQNTEGIGNRQKVRIRWYGAKDLPSNYPNVEIKMKTGTMSMKSLYQLSTAEMSFDTLLRSWRIARTGIFEQSDLPESLIQYLKSVRPAFINSYHRLYFKVAGHPIRLTVDTSVKYFNGAFYRGFSNPFVSVLELKFPPSERERAQYLIRSLPYRQSRFSKFAYGMLLFEN